MHPRRGRTPAVASALEPLGWGVLSLGAVDLLAASSQLRRENGGEDPRPNSDGSSSDQIDSFHFVCPYEKTSPKSIGPAWVIPGALRKEGSRCRAARGGFAVLPR